MALKKLAKSKSDWEKSRLGAWAKVTGIAGTAAIPFLTPRFLATHGILRGKLVKPLVLGSEIAGVLAGLGAAAWAAPYAGLSRGRGLATYAANILGGGIGGLLVSKPTKEPKRTGYGARLATAAGAHALGGLTGLPAALAGLAIGLGYGAKRGLELGSLLTGAIGAGIGAAIGYPIGPLAFGHKLGISRGRALAASLLPAPLGAFVVPKKIKED